MPVGYGDLFGFGWRDWLAESTDETRRLVDGKVGALHGPGESPRHKIPPHLYFGIEAVPQIRSDVLEGFYSFFVFLW